MGPTLSWTDQRKWGLVLHVTLILVLSGSDLWGQGQQSEKSRTSSAPQEASAARDLRLIGEKVARTVLDKDIPGLLTYDRADLRSEDEASLKNTKSDLYCFLFDSSCIEGGKWVSVYDKLSQSHSLGIRAVLAKSSHDGHLYGTLLCYDRTSISEETLGSSDFLCKQSPRKIASWKFKLEDGKWKPVTPFFDSETDGLCGN